MDCDMTCIELVLMHEKSSLKNSSICLDLVTTYFLGKYDYLRLELARYKSKWKKFNIHRLLITVHVWAEPMPGLPSL